MEKKEITLKRGVNGESALKLFVDRGYLLHGSPRDLEIIEPKEAVDFNQNGLFTNLWGVYATFVPAAALFFAITSNVIKKVSGDFGKGRGKFYWEKSLYTKTSSGFVYILSAKDFHAFGDELVSLKSVTPLLKIRVQPSNFKYKIEDIGQLEKNNLYCRLSVDLDQAIAIVEKKMGQRLTSHGRWHIVRTVIYAKILAAKLSPQNLNEILLGVILHDVGRKSDKPDHLHAKRSAGIAKELLQLHWPWIAADRILHAIEYHNREWVSKDLVTGIIWDADRLDLVRFGFRINKRLLSTEFARQLIPFAGFICSKYQG